MKNKKQIFFEVMAIILISVFCISLTPKTLQNDTFYTIKIGEHIIESGGIDMMDSFSWHEGLEYTYPHWLYDVITYLIYSFGGMPGIYILTCIFAVILGICIYKVNSKLAQNKVVSFFITIGTIYMLRDYIAARAQLVTFILFVLQIFFIERLITNKQKRYAMGLIIISILIANLHVAVWPFMFVLYLPYIAEYIIAIFAEKYCKKYGKELKEGYKIIIQKQEGVKYLIIVILICVLTGLLTPLGPSTSYTYLVKTIIGTTTQNITEHLPLTLVYSIDVMIAIIIFLVVLIFTDSKIRLSDLFMLGGLTFLMFYSKRQESMFAIIGFIILNRILYNLMEKHIPNADTGLVKMCTTKLGVVLIVILMLSKSFEFILPQLTAAYIDESSYPVQMSDFILEHFKVNDIDLKDIRIYNEYNYGSYLLYRGIPVFIDSRCDLYAPEYNGGQDIFMSFINSSNLNVWFEDVFEEYGITHVLLHRDSKMNTIIENANLENYILLAKDEFFAFYEIFPQE